MTAPTPASLSTVSLRRIVAGLDRGDRVRVTFTDGHVEVGTLRKSGLSVLDRGDEGLANLLHLDNGMHWTIRNRDGLPALGVANVEPWDESDIFDAMSPDWAEWFDMEREAAICPRSEQEHWNEKAYQAKRAIIEGWIRDQSWTKGLAE